MAFFFFKGKKAKEAAKEEEKARQVDFDSQTSVERETDASII
jgi:hypothetical protein